MGKLRTRPRCDLCPANAVYDARLNYGPWAFVCQRHFEFYKCELGLGKGQRLEVAE